MFYVYLKKNWMPHTQFFDRDAKGIAKIKGLFFSDWSTDSVTESKGQWCLSSLRPKSWAKSMVRFNLSLTRNDWHVFNETMHMYAIIAVHENTSLLGREHPPPWYCFSIITSSNLSWHANSNIVCFLTFAQISCFSLWSVWKERSKVQAVSMAHRNLFSFL